MTIIARPLDNQGKAHNFLVNVIRLEQDVSYWANQVFRNEKINSEQLKDNTLASEEHRDPQYRNPDVRKTLRETVVSELLSFKRPSSDDEIRLGYGGSLPQTALRHEQQAYIVLGPPASGKSRIANTISDSYGCVVIDPDHAKLKLPEFQGGVQAAAVHAESSALVFGCSHHVHPDVGCVIERAMSENMNLVIPKVGKSKNSIVKLAERLGEYGYRVHLVLTSLDRCNAVRRAFERFQATGRYVPLAYVFDTVANEPQLNYYRLRIQEKYKSLWESHAAYSTDDSYGDSPFLLCCSESWSKLRFHATV